ncbi:MAG: SpoVG family protein [Treponema sp.]|jgi:stage V sporulation protein G|nr:SpoVG family protein [Treponema sp.]
MADNKLDIRVYPLENPQGNTKAFASIAVDDLIAIRGVRVVESEKGLFVSMPQSQDKKTNEYRDVAFPVNGDLRKEINQAVLDEYTRVINLAPDERSYDKPETDAASNINAADIKLDIRVYAVSEAHGNAKAFASVTVEDVIAIRGLRVVEGDKDLFVTMPQSKDKNGDHHDIAFPLNGNLRKESAKAVLEK